MKENYKLIAHSDWLANYSITHPYAVMNDQKTEVVLTLNDGTGELTREQAQEYIATNWRFADEH